MNRISLAALFLRFGLAFVFAYAAIAAWIAPINWVGFIPLWLKNITSGFLSLQKLSLTISLFQLFLALWLLSGKKLLFSAVAAALFLAGIALFNWEARDIVFRDAGLFFAALALAALSKR